MRPTPIERYAVLGAQLWNIRGVAAGLATGPVAEESTFLSSVAQFREILEEVGMPVTVRAGQRLWDLTTEVGDLAPTTLTAEQATQFNTLGAELWLTFQAEAGGKIAFVASDKRYDVNRLLADVRSLMAPNTFDGLPAVARFDMAEAGVCIAFERPTAAAFHTLRAAEATLRQFYRSFVRRGRIAEPWLWAPIVIDLRSKATPPPSVLLDQLDALRRNFRNPTQHPEKTYDIDEAQDLFSSTIEVLNRMVSAPKYIVPNPSA